MIKFSNIETNFGEVKGFGEYRNGNDYLIINTNDSTVVDYFNKIVDDKKTLSTIIFSGLESDAIYSGKFLIKEIRKEVATTRTEIFIAKA